MNQLNRLRNDGIPDICVETSYGYHNPFVDKE